MKDLKLPIPIISNGHGGVIAGKYQTPGKRSPLWPDGSILYEGEFNRAIKSRVIEMLSFEGIPYIDLVTTQADKMREARVRKANAHHYLHKNTFLIDIHSNAAPEHLKGKARGSEVFISHRASNNSHRLANFCTRYFRYHFPNERWRGIKIKNWDMVHKTHMPAILVECFFMDNKRECKTYLMTKEGRDKIAKWIFDIIIAYRKYHTK